MYLIFMKKLENSYSTVHPKHDHGDEEQTRPYLRSRQGCNSLWIHFKNKAGALIGDFSNGFVLVMRHVPKVGENDKSRKETGE